MAADTAWKPTTTRQRSGGASEGAAARRSGILARTDPTLRRKAIRLRKEGGHAVANARIGRHHITSRHFKTTNQQRLRADAKTTAARRQQAQCFAQHTLSRRQLPDSLRVLGIKVEQACRFSFAQDRGAKIAAPRQHGQRIGHQGSNLDVGAPNQQDRGCDDALIAPRLTVLIAGG